MFITQMQQIALKRKMTKTELRGKFIKKVPSQITKSKLVLCRKW